jgi:hypothetical protein
MSTFSNSCAAPTFGFDGQIGEIPRKPDAEL